LKIGFIGAGKVGKALGLYFSAHDLDIVGYCSRSIQSAHEAAGLTGKAAFETVCELAAACDTLFITTPDRALADIDRQVSALLNEKRIEPKKVWIHVSGAYASDHLAGIRAAGCPTGSIHPLQSFGEPFMSAKQLETTFFSVEGTEEAVNIIKQVLGTTGGRYNEIDAGCKPLYHAGACVISNYLFTLLDSGLRYMEAAGMDRKTLLQAVMPLISGTLLNTQEKGTIDALTGPIARGDFDTVSLHLDAIKKKLPSELELYRAMAMKTVTMIEEKRLTPEQADRFRELLKG
jgi:predicted short-subunit dehydrogenase-like oxidoreductase (DUF2520 family)